ncbi:hypothetical protein [Hymenobacter pini]|uniref:hypothetical protein n=1 Tax=Hymenobacter pini TaxID=2880879 RepID=UPI001CF5E804|nr:hypothetical protein [Hymenobacter pini]
MSAATAWAQDEAKAPATPTNLPGEEKLSAQERAERDFLMPVRRKQAAKLRATAEEAGVHQPAIEATAHNLETLPEAEKLVPVAAPEAKAAPAVVHRRTSSSHRRHTSTHRSSSRTSSRKKTTAKKSTAKKTSTRKKSSRRR